MARYSTDTRTIEPGEVYVAIRGETHDGHRFIPQAIEKGASAVVTEQDVDVPAGVDVVRVESTLGYLTDAAHEKVRRIGPDIVAITGSVGKTTTRAAVLAVVREAFEAVAPTGNLNTPLGLSLLVLNAEIGPDTKLVLEMGARLPGDLAELCRLFPPTVSVVTNVKGVHVETLGSLDGVQHEKGSLVRALGPDGTAVLNGDDPRVRQMADGHPGRTLFYGTGPDVDLGPDRITATLPLLGAPAAYAALAATGVGLALGLDDATITRGLENVQPEKGRLARLRGRDGSTLIDDTYNASPDAALAALRVLGGFDGRRIAVLGDMLELGPTEVEQHADVLRAALDHADRVVAVGAIMGRAVDALGAEEGVSHAESSAALAEAVRQRDVDWPRAGDIVLVKGSQGTRMERVSEALLHPDLDPADWLPRQTEAWKQIA